MAEIKFVQYDGEAHEARFFELNLEYLTLVDSEVYRVHGIHINPEGTVQEYLEVAFPKFTEIKPPNGIIYILEADGEADGMGALRKLEDGVGEIKRMYIRPQHRGHGYGQEMYDRLEKKAEEFGFSTLRLDTADFPMTAAALHIYRKNGFKEIGSYSGGEWDGRSDTDGITIYMEKKL